MWFTAAAIGLALFFAMNIGASGAAATMGVAYGSGAIPYKRLALVLVAVGVFAGAYLGGGEVVKTIGGGIVPSDLLRVQLSSSFCYRLPLHYLSRICSPFRCLQVK